MDGGANSVRDAEWTPARSHRPSIQPLPRFLLCVINEGKKTSTKNASSFPRLFHSSSAIGSPVYPLHSSLIPTRHRPSETRSDPKGLPISPPHPVPLPAIPIRLSLRIGLALPLPSSVAAHGESRTVGAAASSLSPTSPVSISQLRRRSQWRSQAGKGASELP